MIAELKRDGVTVLITSHLLDQVQRLCDRVALFQGGRILVMGTVPELSPAGARRGIRGVDVEATAAPGKDLAGPSSAPSRARNDVGGADRQQPIPPDG